MAWVSGSWRRCARSATLPGCRRRRATIQNQLAVARANSKGRIAVLISGRGSNLAALADAICRTPDVAHISAVLSDRANAAGLRIAEHVGFARSLVIATDSSAMAGRAPRPADVSLDNSRARSLLATPMLSMREGLKLTVKAVGE